MAASHSRDASEALGGTRRYREVIERALFDARALADAPVREEPNGGERVLIVVGSEHGFVGGFNQRIIDRTREVHVPDERLVLVGQRAAMRAEECGLAADDVHSMTTHIPGVEPSARRLADLLDPEGDVRIVFAAPRPGGLSEIAVATLLPAATDTVTEVAAPPLHHLPAPLLLDRLREELLLAELAHALMSSLASENGARLHAMEAAGRNIGNRLDQLRQRERVVRQEEITADLIEIVSGAEAVSARAASRQSADSETS